MSVVAPAVIALASGTSAYLSCARIRAERDRCLGLIAFLVLWAVFLIVPVQVLAGLQMGDVIHKITSWEIAETELAITIVAAAIWFAIPRTHPIGHTRAVARHWVPPFYLIASAGVVCASYLLGAINLCTSFPQGSDALTYHLPVAVRWLQEGSLQLPASHAWRFSLPGNGEILMMLALATGKQSLAPIFNWASCALLVICLFVLSRRFTSCANQHALIVVLVALSIPIVFFQTFSAYVDLFGTACLLSALALFLHRHSQAQPSETLSEQLPASTETKKLSMPVLAVAAMAAGLSFGTKPIYYVYCGLFFLMALITLWRERRTQGVPFPALAALLALGMLLPSSFWFLRGWVEAGNPVFPIQVKVGTHVMLPGYAPSEITTARDKMNFVDREAEWAVYLWTEWVREAGSFPSSYNEVSGAGGAFATFVPLGIAFTFINLRKNWRQRPIFLLLFAWIGLLAIWFGVMHQVPRFGLPLWVTACIFVAPVFKTIEDYYPRIIRALLVISVAGTFVISSLVPLHALAGRILKNRWSRSGIYAYPAVIDNLPPGSRVLNYSEFSEQNFPLEGKNLSNRLVPSFEAPNILAPYYMSSQGIDYVVEAVPDSGHAEAVPPPLPDPISAIAVDESRTGGKIWRIYKVVR